MDVIARAPTTGVCNEKPTFHVDADGIEVVLSCAKNKNPFEGNHISFDIPGKRPLKNPNNLEIKIIHDGYCKPEQPACDCDRMLDKVFNYAPNQKVTAVYVNYLPLEICECVLLAAHRNFGFTSVTRAHLRKPICRGTKTFVFDFGAKEVCDFYRANECGNGEILLNNM